MILVIGIEKFEFSTVHIFPKTAQNHHDKNGHTDSLVISCNAS